MQDHRFNTSLDAENLENEMRLRIMNRKKIVLISFRYLYEKQVPALLAVFAHNKIDYQRLHFSPHAKNTNMIFKKVHQ